VTAPLAVDTDALRRTGSSFVADAGRLAALDVTGSLGIAASGVPGLKTAEACRAAETTVRAIVAANVAATRTYGSNLTAAAKQYDTTDHRSGRAIAGVKVPEPAG
jgi:hypothetical protein